MATAEFKQVSKRYHQSLVIDNMDLTIGSGEFMVLVGPSGCGKSTLLRMLAGLESISSGEVLIEGKRMNEVAPSKREVAMVFQNYALYPHMSVAKNLGFGIMTKVSKSECQERVTQVAESLQIESLLNRYPKQLSGGQRQRVAIGRAIVRRPKIFLFDEPLSNLDAKLRVQMRIELAKLHQQLNTTMVYVTHDQIEAMTLGQRVVVLNQGRLEQVGSPLELYQQPANRFVAEFLGTPKINILEYRFDPATQTINFGAAESTSVANQSLIEKLQLGKHLAVRPECLLWAEQDWPIKQTILAQIQFIETLGDSVVYYLKLKDSSQTLVIKVAESNCSKAVNDWVRLRANESDLHIFDASGSRL